MARDQHTAQRAARTAAAGRRCGLGDAGGQAAGKGAAAAAARGETVSSRIDTGFFLVTPSTSGVYKKMVGIN